jgi:proline dehydrogenase
MLRKIRDNIVSVISSRHIAGEEITDALQVCRWADREGFNLIISPWSGAADTPKGMLERYKSAIESISKEGMKFYLSIKLDSIGYDAAVFDDLLDFARSKGIRVHIDSLGPDTADTAISFLERGISSNHDVGYTFASRWLRSVTDATIIAGLGVPVRIVKGQWKDPAAHRLNCRKNYLEIVDRLAGGTCKVGVATHDLPLAKEALGKLSSTKTSCELEQFFSLPLNGVQLAKKMGLQYRIYVAYGHPGIPYNVRFALTRPGIAVWMLADFALNRRKPWMPNHA